MKSKNDISVENSTGNVFADIGVPDPVESMAKAKLLQRICDIVKDRQLSQRQAASLLGIDQPKVSAILRGKIGGFSSDRLFRFLNLLGQDVRITVQPRPKKPMLGDTQVMTL